jgi:hypothetical protein
VTAISQLLSLNSQEEQRVSEFEFFTSSIIGLIENAAAVSLSVARFCKCHLVRFSSWIHESKYDGLPPVTGIVASSGALSKVE